MVAASVLSGIAAASPVEGVDVGCEAMGCVGVGCTGVGSVGVMGVRGVVGWESVLGGGGVVSVDLESNCCKVVAFSADCFEAWNFCKASWYSSSSFS